MKPPANATEKERLLWLEIDENKIPEHVAIIMDGNGRWAKKRGLSRIKGHKAGAKAIENALDSALHLGVKVITVYAFSTENWIRPEYEVSVLMTLLFQFLKLQKKKLMDKDIKLSIIGDRSKLPLFVNREIDRVLDETRENKSLIFNIALNYGGRADILNAVKNLIEAGIKPDDLNEKLFSSYLYTKDLPDPDLLIRTSGEIRVSNFLLWQIAYSELYFTDILWPDFDTIEMLKAILEYQKRERRFGGTGGI
ncbi:undecaprenyl diphosphate synthase [Thermotomaculum hydrothermale]|uniref:Isoprenyl transferase n=1 Tax=Thermotomaculum hydrothermale TaxID=981385 RepID=A0A7R6SYL8_9BACT|nr:isoprenyl transferase [Thermotomaculum hydrothermale]BBB32701.1 undecaprenyl diphosphate synthase [Thermotomaculum hydrothermale]